MGDWLGTGTVAPSHRVYRPFTKARDFVRTLGLKSGAEWTAYCRGNMSDMIPLPADIPASPARTYSGKGWKGMGDWLGTEYIANQLRQYRSFNLARVFARGLNLQSGKEWSDFCKGHLDHIATLPPDIPRHPGEVYANKGWVSMGDWLGTGYVASRHRVYRPFKEARAFARKLQLRSESEWRAFRSGQFPDKGELPDDIPRNPDGTYRDKGWISWPDWLGTKRSGIGESGKV
jgi:hypothetical protein